MQYLARLFKPFVTRRPNLWWLQLAAMLVVAQSCGQSDASSLMGPTATPTVSPLDSAVVQLTPQQVTLASGDSNQFVAVEIVPDSGEVAPDVVWTATGGTITPTGLFVAGTTPGSYQVMAQVRGHSRWGTAPVIVATPLLTSLTLSPATASLNAGATQQFAVGGTWSNGSTTAPAVTYSVTGGTMTAGGLYTAGSAPGTFRVIATQQGGTKADTSIVNIAVPAAVLVQMVLAPAAVTLAPAGSAQFGVTGTWSDGSVTAPAVSYAATGGTITAGGVYTAGATAGTYRVIATQQGGAKADTSAVTITAAAATLSKLTISPKSVSLAAGAAQPFTVSGVWSDGSVTVPAATYSATGGTITAGGVYTAGATAGTFRVIAVQQSGTRADTAVITVTVASPTLTKLAISPKSISLAEGGVQQFAVSGVWSDGSMTVPVATYSATGGMITASGSYTAGATAGTFRVIAVQLGGTKADTAAIIVTGAASGVPSYTRPFADNSPWNSPISAYQSASYLSTSALAGFTPAMSTWPGALWVSMWQATASDPVVNLYYNPNAWTNVASGRWKRSGNSPAIEAEIRQGIDQEWGGYEANMYSSTSSGVFALPAVFHSRESTYWSLNPHVPAGAVPPPDADGHMTVFQPNGWALEMYAPIVMSNGDIVSLFASYTDPTGDGAGDESGRRATMVPNYAGIVRNGELGSGQINHALSIGLGPEALAKSVVWPAVAMDRDAATSYSGSIPMGSLLAIPAAVDVTHLGLQTSQGLTIAKAAQQYGAYVTDRTGSKYFLITTETNAPDVPPWSGPLGADLQIIMTQLKLTTLGARN